MKTKNFRAKKLRIIKRGQSRSRITEDPQKNIELGRLYQDRGGEKKEKKKVLRALFIGDGPGW